MSRRLAIIEGQRLALALGSPDPSQAQRIKALEAQNAALRRQLAAREVPQQPDPLAEHNAELHAAGMRLRATIAALLEAHPGPKRGAARPPLERSCSCAMRSTKEWRMRRWRIRPSRER